MSRRFITIGLVLGLAMFVGIFWVIRPEGVWETVKEFSALKFLVFVAVIVLPISIVSFRWQVIIRALGGPKIALRTLWLYRAASFALSYITPASQVGGEPVRVALVSRHGITRERAWASVLVEDFFEISSQIIISVIILFLVVFSEGFSVKADGLLLLSGLVLVFGTSLMYLRLMTGKGFFVKAFRFVQGHRISFLRSLEKPLRLVERDFLDFFLNHRAATISSLVAMFAWFAAGALEVALLMWLLGFHPSLLQVLAAKVLLNIAGLVPVPASLGVAEWSQAGFFEASLGGASGGVGFALIWRARDFLFAILGFSIMAFYGARSIVSRNND